jgi:hypothetical protein
MPIFCDIPAKAGTPTSSRATGMTNIALRRTIAYKGGAPQIVVQG